MAGKGTAVFTHVATRRPRLCTEWQDRAACRGARLDFTSDNLGTQLAAKQVCWQQCPVRAECLDYALARKEPAGVGGGYTPEERDTVRSRRGRKAGAR